MRTILPVTPEGDDTIDARGACPRDPSEARPTPQLDLPPLPATIPATMGFSLPLLLGLLAACAVMMVLERRGLPTTLSLTFKGDIKRESRWLAQYGQCVCTFVAALLVWQLDVGHRWN